MATEQTPTDATPDETPKPRTSWKPKTVKAKAPRAPRTPALDVAPAAPQVTGITETGLANALASAMVLARPAEKKTMANRTPHNPMNPTNEPRPAWRKKFFVNFDEMDTQDVTPEEYRLVPQLKPGVFIKGRNKLPLVEVLIVKRGRARGLHIRWNNAKRDRRMELQNHAPTLQIMMEKCIKEAGQQAELRAQRRAAGIDEDDED